MAKSQAKILGLCILTLPSGKEVGDGLRVMLSALPEKKANDVLIVIDQKVGDLYRQALGGEEEDWDADDFIAVATTAREEIQSQEEKLSPVTKPVAEAAEEFLALFIQMKSLPDLEELDASYTNFAEAFQEVALNPEHR